jgi:ATP-dependent RNA helicase RhlE
MLDMGFIHDVKRVIQKLPSKRQTLLFSATMPNEVAKLAHTILHHPVRVEVAPQSTTAEKVDQSVYFVEKPDKPGLLVDLLRGPAMEEVLVFTRTKHGANKLAKHLIKSGIRAEAIHGNKSQSARQNALNAFKQGRLRVLVATDIAARGIDIDDLKHVVNYDLPNVPETYVHRIGRTGRAGASGHALSFCAADERPFLRDITRLIARQIPVVESHAFSNGSSAPRTNGSQGAAIVERNGHHPRPAHPQPHRDGRDGNRRRRNRWRGPRRGR